MTRSERWLERAIEWIGLTAERLIRSGSWWRRWLGIALGSSALCCVLPLLAFWLLFGKKPKETL